MVPGIHVLPSSLCIAILDPVGLKGMFLKVFMSSFNWGCLFRTAVRLSVKEKSSLALLPGADQC